MLRRLVKIANKLDSLGLTKEADTLDRYIEKNAGLFHDVTPPPQWAQDAFKKWLTTTSFYNRTYSLKGGGEVASFIPTSSVDAARTAYGEIISMSAFVRKELQKDPTAYNLYGWYIDNIRSSMVYSETPYLLSKDFNELASKLEEVADDTPNLPELQRLYREAAAHLKETATLWKARQNKPAPATPSTPKKSEQPMTMTSTDTYPPYKDPKINLRPWDKYAANTKYGAAVEKAWKDFVRTDPPDIGTDYSFAAYKSWYKDRLGTDWGGKHKSQDEIIRLLKLETKLNAEGDFTSPRV